MMLIGLAANAVMSMGELSGAEGWRELKKNSGKYFVGSQYAKLVRKNNYGIKYEPIAIVATVLPLLSLLPAVFTATTVTV